MRLGAGQASAKLTLFSRLSAASGAINRQGLVPVVENPFLVSISKRERASLI
jgi:hypothetical protein